MTQIKRKRGGQLGSIIQFNPLLWESDGPICARLWSQGYNTLEIASIMGAKEHEIYNSLRRWRGKQ